MQPPSGAHDHGNLIQNAAVAPFTTASPSALGKEADDYHASVRVDIKRGVHTSSNATVAQTGEKWIGDAEERLEPATVESYRQHLRDHIIPFIGAVKFSQLTVPGCATTWTGCEQTGARPPWSSAWSVTWDQSWPMHKAAGWSRRMWSAAL
jgi:hypothetical protein